MTSPEEQARKSIDALLTAAEVQSVRYTKGLRAWRRPLSIVYKSTGIETHFTNALDLDPCARNDFAFHKPDTLADGLC